MVIVASRRIVYFYLFSLLISAPSYAIWYQGSAQQSVKFKDFDEVRTQTIKQAVANASMQGHSYIQAEHVTLEGLLQSSKTILRSEGQIRRIEILSESIDEDILSVHVKVDIKPFLGCQDDPYVKSLLVTQIPILNPKQASQGALFDLGIHTTKRFEQQLYSQPKVSVSALLDKSLIQTNTLGSIEKKYLAEIGRYVATEYDSQFILFGSLRDISLFEQVKDGFISDETLLRRNFTLQLYLYDALRGDILLQKSYHGEGSWPYPTNYTVDTSNSLFWRTDYGRATLHTINSAVTDISEILSCQQSLAQIVDNSFGELVINIGAKHGVKVGDKFQLINQRLLKSGTGKERALLNSNSSRTLNVMRVNSQNSVLTSDWLNTLDDGQILNLVSPKFIF